MSTMDFDPSLETTGGMSAEPAAATGTSGDPGAAGTLPSTTAAPFDPSQAYDPSQPLTGGMSVGDGAAESVGQDYGGPNSSQGPTPWQAGYEAGQKEQYTHDTEALGHEDPVGDVVKALAHGTAGVLGDLLEKGADLLHDFEPADVDTEPWEPGADVADATVNTPDATVAPDGGSNTADGASFGPEPGSQSDITTDATSFDGDPPTTGAVDLGGHVADAGTPDF